MNYLRENLTNSLILPFDVVKIIYEYADPFIYIKNQIKNKEYKLQKSYILHREDILGIPNHYTINHKKYLMIYQLRGTNVYKYNVYNHLNADMYKMENVYKKWLKL